MNRLDDFFVIPVNQNYLLYAPLNGRYALLNAGAVHVLKDFFLQRNTGPLAPDFEELANLLSGPPLRTPERNGNITPDFLGIIPSRRCNMACVYCDFGAHQGPGLSMDPDMMVAAIDWYVSFIEARGGKRLPIQFFGGEPFVEQELIDIAVHHARLVGERTGLIPHFEVLSNGYMSESQRMFVGDYFDRVVISLDGFKKYHDITRLCPNGRSSYNVVINTIRYLSRQNIDLAIRCCITSESVMDMEAIANWLCREFKPTKVNFETLTENKFTRAAGLTPADPYTFAEHCLKSWRVLCEHHVEPAYAPIVLDRPQTTSCPVGRDVLIVHPDGMIASCYVQEKDWQAKDIDLVVGKVLANGMVEIDEERLLSLRNQLDDKPRCRDCFCRYGCAGGCHVNNTFPGSPENYTDYCIHTRIMTACRLLEEMGMTELADELLNSKTAMEKLALNHSDKLVEFQE